VCGLCVRERALSRLGRSLARLFALLAGEAEPSTLEAVTAVLVHCVDSALRELGGMGTTHARLTVVYDRSQSPGACVRAVMERQFPECLVRAYLYPTSGTFRFGWKVGQVRHTQWLVGTGRHR
jgi:hypothetical protein